ncbi:MAG TPA: metal ABC transporter substrate-binding protein, partial [Longimicrobiales bacterium]|nr:metal ABC transporter substrate-binding protein [Longimicrobiales bacterium]
RDFIATHEAWTYFAERYDLHELGSLYQGPGHEPSAQGLARLVDSARAAGLRAVLAEPQFAETAARALADEVGAEVVVVDPLGGPGVSDREGYFQLMRFNARAFARALGNP